MRQAVSDPPMQLESGMTLDFSMLPTHNLSVRANTEPSLTGRVAFDLDGSTHVENILPYAIAGDDTQGNYIPWTPAPNTPDRAGSKAG
jgi:hypothetical protein